MFHASTPVVLLTGLLGGPLAGAVAGAVTAVPGIVERRDVKRSLTYGGIGSLQGLLAGLAGLAKPTRNTVCVVPPRTGTEDDRPAGRAQDDGPWLDPSPAPA